MSMARTLWAASGLEHAMKFQLANINGKVQLQRYVPAPPAYDICACGVARNCPDPSWSGAQFLCYYGNNCTVGTVIWNIPGLTKACTPIESVMGSDLRCFFDKICLDMFLSMYNIDMPKRQPLPSAILHINTLNSSTLSSFRPDDTIETLFRELMIDDWILGTNYVGYYNSCAPAKCTYTVTRRMNLFYVFTMITTFFGGIAVTFSLIVPICVRFFYWILTYRQAHHSDTHDQRSPNHSRGKYISLPKNKVWNYQF